MSSKSKWIDDFNISNPKLKSFVKCYENIFCEIDQKLDYFQFTYIYGLSGLGKSTLAREYGHYRKQQSPNCVVLFVNSLSFELNLLELKSRINDPLIDNVTNKDDLLRVIRAKINSCEVDFLFIF